HAFHLLKPLPDKMKWNNIFSFLNPAKQADNAMQRVESGRGYWAMVRKQFRKNRLALFSFRFVIFLVILSSIADIVANEKPLVCRYKDNLYFPVCRSLAVSTGITNWPADLQNAEWKKLNYDWVLFPPVPYLP